MKHAPIKIPYSLQQTRVHLAIRSKPLLLQSGFIHILRRNMIINRAGLPANKFQASLTPLWF